MSKTITIPSDKGNPVVVVINGESYKYTAGETVTVPDKVAELLEANAHNVIYGRAAAAPLGGDLYDGGNGAPVKVAPNGRMFVDSADALRGVYVENHKLIIPAASEE